MALSQNPVEDARRTGLLARDMLDTIGDRWSAIAVYVLNQRPARFSELKARIDALGSERLHRLEISNKMLAATLRRLARNGLVTRDAADGRYILTALGRSFWQPMMAIHDWAADHREEIEAARQHFDLER
jgi:DNA-binding HxlR family transcriptional regulator